MVAWQWRAYNTVHALLHNTQTIHIRTNRQAARVSDCKIKSVANSLVRSSCSPQTTSSTLPGACSLKMANRIHTCPSCISQEDTAVAYTKPLTREPLLSFLTNRSRLRTQFPFSSLNTVQLPPSTPHTQPDTWFRQDWESTQLPHQVICSLRSASRVHCISKSSVNLRPCWRLYNNNNLLWWYLSPAYTRVQEAMIDI